jgi:predicted acyltransferase
MTAQWWGILGLIGWAYLLGSLMFQLTRGRVLWLMLGIVLCTAYFIANRFAAIVAHPWLAMLFSQEGHFSHAAIVLSGCVTAMLFFDERIQRSAGYRFLVALAFALALALVASVLRPEFKISKIYATPSWALYSAASCVLIFAVLYQWTDRGGRDLLPGLLTPVAANPLVAYLIPFVVGSAMQLAGWVPSAVVRSPGLGVMYGVAYSLLVALIVKIISSRGIRLRI